MILVVDDEPLIRLGIADHLMGCGYAVLEAANAHDAIALLSQPGCCVDLILSDVRMPGQIDGFGLRKWVRNNLPGTPVILISGHVGKSVADICEGKIIPKPFEYAFIAETIEQELTPASA